MQAALAGLGFAVLPTYLADPMIAEGKLVRVLEDRMPEGPSLMAVYPHRRHLAGKVRALIDHLVEWFADQSGSLRRTAGAEQHVRRLLSLFAAPVAVLALSAPAAAHPHIFIDAKATIVFNDAGDLVAIQQQLDVR